VQQFEDIDLIAQIEPGGRLIQQNGGRLLGQRHGDPAALTLAAGEAIHRQMGKFGGTGERSASSTASSSASDHWRISPCQG
jgi:hypothetical protein